MGLRCNRDHPRFLGEAVTDHEERDQLPVEAEPPIYEPPSRVASSVWWVLGILVYAAVIALALAFIYGLVWVVDKLLPLALFLTALGSALFVFMLLPSAIFKGSRRFCGKGIVVVSYIWGITLWVLAIRILYAEWGTLAMLLGIVFLPPGAVLLLFVALFFQGDFPLMGLLLLLVILIYSVRALGRWIVSKGHKPTPTPIIVSYPPGPWDQDLD